MAAEKSSLSQLVRSRQADILNEWLALQLQSVASRRDLISENELRQQSRDFLEAYATALESPDRLNISGAAWQPVREMLTQVSQSRGRQGFTPSETATFVFSLKQPLFTQIQQHSADKETLADHTWTTTLTLDRLGLLTTEAYQKGREEVILRQTQELMELSTPVVTLWAGVLALPLIGTLDSGRTQVVMENLLQRIVETGSSIAILDITGVPTVDTLVAQHLLKTVAAARLMGADCIISGIRPQIAQTIVHLGVDLNSVTTKATLADAFAVALRRLGLAVTARTAASAGGPAAAGAAPKDETKGA
jgi:rsbT co-antagonist protein RsbR